MAHSSLTLGSNRVIPKHRIASKITAQSIVSPLCLHVHSVSLTFGTEAQRRQTVSVQLRVSPRFHRSRVLGEDDNRDTPILGPVFRRIVWGYGTILAISRDGQSF